MFNADKWHNEVDWRGIVVAGYLNEDRKSRSGRKVADLISKIRQSQRQPENQGLEKEINQLLAPYHFRRYFRPGEREPVIYPVEHLGISATETEIVGLLLDLVLLRGLDRLRQCKRRGCPNWFAATRTDKQFCDEGRCSQRIYRRKLLKKNPRYFADKMAEYRERNPGRKKRRRGDKGAFC
jgi:hypothetical protein